MLLTVSVIRKQFDNGVVVLRSQEPGDIAFNLSKGEAKCLFGPSGCGKSTLLRLIAGIDTDFEGDIRVMGSQIRAPGRSVGMMMQGDTSFPWLTVAQNISFSRRYTSCGRGEGLGGAEIDEAKEYARLVNLPFESLNLYPHQISGGMKQRMLFARVLVSGPSILLFDEPFSSLDRDARERLQDLVIELRSKLNLSYLIVSHDPDEAVLLSDEVLILGEQPARIVRRMSTRLYGQRSRQFTQEFQEARKALYA